MLASAASTVTYAKNKNLDIKNGLVMMGFVLLFTVVGSLVAKLLPGTVMGGFSTVMTLLLGVKFLIKPIMTAKEKREAVSKKKQIIQSAISGTFVGFICGFVGAGGGMMMLLLLTSVLGYELKTAVGTSVFIMTFTALTGAISHFVMAARPTCFALSIASCSPLSLRLSLRKSPTKPNRPCSIGWSAAYWSSSARQFFWLPIFNEKKNNNSALG